MTNAKTKSDSLKLLSLNVRGLSNFRKRKAIFTWCRKQKADLIFLQETHSTKVGECKWKKEWGSKIIFSHGSLNARGVAVLIKRGLDIVIQQELLNSNGRSIVLKALIKDKSYLLANIYGPNKDVEAVQFYQNLSPYLFIIVAEVLATAIRSRTNIQGIKIGKEEFKFVQYADDLTVFVPDIESAQHIFILLDQFETCSGLKVKYTKTEAMWIGSCRNNTAAPLGLKWVNTVKALGIVFSIMKPNSCRNIFMTN